MFFIRLICLKKVFPVHIKFRLETEDVEYLITRYISWESFSKMSCPFCHLNGILILLLPPPPPPLQKLSFHKKDNTPKVLLPIQKNPRTE